MGNRFDPLHFLSDDFIIKTGCKIYFNWRTMNFYIERFSWMDQPWEVLGLRLGIFVKLMNMFVTYAFKQICRWKKFGIRNVIAWRG